MAHLMTIILASIISLDAILAQQVHMFIDTTTIYEGDQVQILCHLFGLQSNNIAIIEQETQSGEKIRWMQDGQLKTDLQDGDPEVRTVDTNANIKSYMLTFNAITRANAGSYMCHAIELTEEGAPSVVATLLQSDTIEVVVNYLPSDQYPICNGNESAFTVGDHAKFTCMSQDGIPDVFLKWTHYGAVSNVSEIYQRQLGQNGTVQSTLDIIATSSMNGSYFVCQIYSASFPTSNMSCSIGPIFVSSGLTDLSNNGKEKESDTKTGDNNTVVLLLIITVITIVVLAVFGVAVTISCYKRRENGKSIEKEILTGPRLPDRPSVISRTSVESPPALESQPVSQSTHLGPVNHYEQTPPTPRSFPKRDALEKRNSHYEHTPKPRRNSLNQSQSNDNLDSTDNPADNTSQTSDEECPRPEHPYERTLSRRLKEGDQESPQESKPSAVNNAYLEVLE